MGGGGLLRPNYTGCVCPKVKDMVPFFRLQVSEISEKISLKICLKLADSLNIGENFN